MRTEYEDTSVAGCEDTCIFIYLAYLPDLEIHAALVYEDLSY